MGGHHWLRHPAPMLPSHSRWWPQKNRNLARWPSAMPVVSSVTLRTGAGMIASVPHHPWRQHGDYRRSSYAVGQAANG